jgi:predicted amidohydrolase
VVGVNRVGDDPNVTYSGHSMVIDPMGEIIADAGERETILDLDLDLAAATQWRTEFPAQSDRRAITLPPSD